MAKIHADFSTFMELILSISITHHNFLILTVAAAALVFVIMSNRRITPVYLLDFVCYRPSDSCRLPMSMFQEHINLNEAFDSDSVRFLTKVLEKSGFSDETCIPPTASELPIRKSLSSTREEAETIILSMVKELLARNNMNPKTIDILITNSSSFSPTPSLSAMVVNEYGMRSNILSFNLSGMGCSAGILSVSLARDLLRVHRNSVALVISTEMISQNWYNGKKRSMLLTNCLFRMGGAAIVLSNRDQDKKTAKYVLQHLVRTCKASEDQSYKCVMQDTDMENKVGVSLSKDILGVASGCLKANIASLGPMVLPFSEQLRYGMSVIGRKIWIFPAKKRNTYVPNFKRAFEHFCIHSGGKAVIEAIEESMRLSKEDVEASKMTLYRFGNTSSSSIWYELSYIEAKGRMKRGDRVCQIAFGSGFKCNTAVWKCVSDVGPEIVNAWTDRIHLYPVYIPDDVVKID